MSTVWRAKSGPLVLGTYTNLVAAQAHCEFDLQQRAEGLPGPTIWLDNSSDPGIWDLWAAAESGDPAFPLGYFVVSVEVQDKFDPERDA